VANVHVSPETFSMVHFDAAEIEALARRLADDVGFPDDIDVDIRIDETVPLGRVRIASTDPVVLEIDGGAFEDPKRLRRFHPAGAQRVLGRLLLQTRDLRRPDFGEPPARDDLSLELRTAWDVYAMGRVARLGLDAQQQRWLYAFRTRHGFSDGVDRAFDALWSADELTWADIERISSEAAASGSALAS
jgi:hypothetical protein